jgi:uncharacterized membrane protein (DUF106 family)
MMTRTYRNSHNARISSRGREVLILIIAIVIGMIASVVSNILEDTSYMSPTKSDNRSTSYISQTIH